MDIKFLKATKYAFESTTLQFSKAIRTTAVKWKPNYRTSSEAKRHYEDRKHRSKHDEFYLVGFTHVRNLYVFRF